MKDYIKPSFTLAGLFPVALAAGSGCFAKVEQVQAAFERLGWEYTDTAINSADQCEVAYPLDMYCKYAAVDTLEYAQKVLNS